MLSPDKHKMNGPERRFFAFLVHLAYDLEGLAAGAGKDLSRECEEAHQPPAESEVLHGNHERHKWTTHKLGI